jgi:hypothetical protein
VPPELQRRTKKNACGTSREARIAYTLLVLLIVVESNTIPARGNVRAPAVWKV